MTDLGAELPDMEARYGVPGVWDPMSEWLQANGISLSDIPQMPALYVRGSTIVCESFYPDATERRSTLFLKTALAKFEREWPLVVDPPDGLLDTYDDARQEWLADQTVTALGRAGATVVYPAAGDTIVLVSSQEVDNKAMGHLHQVMMGVDVVVCDNITAVVHVKGGGA